MVHPGVHSFAAAGIDGGLTSRPSTAGQSDVREYFLYRDARHAGAGDADAEIAWKTDYLRGDRRVRGIPGRPY